MKRFFYTIALMFAALIGQAQNDSTGNSIQQATGLRADGKIWVVMAVCVTILVGLILYVIMLDRKISRLEKK